jgi:hypothetical protein
MSTTRFLKAALLELRTPCDACAFRAACSQPHADGGASLACLDFVFWAATGSMRHQLRVPLPEVADMLEHRGVYAGVHDTAQSAAELAAKTRAVQRRFPDYYPFRERTPSWQDIAAFVDWSESREPGLPSYTGQTLWHEIRRRGFNPPPLRTLSHWLEARRALQGAQAA